LYKLRSKHNLSMSELAAILGFKTKSAINQFEKSASLPSLPTLLKIADFFCVSLDYLAGRSDEPEYEKFLAPAEEAFLSHPATSKDLIAKYQQDKADHPIEIAPVLLRDYENIRDDHGQK
jgi:transcriptional regulator with XRE-family HTH domain